jgi:FAD-linked sulfhydryl oxidase
MQEKEEKKPCKACFDFSTWKKALQQEKSRPIIKNDKEATEEEEKKELPICPPDSLKLGRATWTFLHTTASYYPDKPTEENKQSVVNLLNSISSLYPCNYCASHLGEYLIEHPIRNSKY